MLQSTGSRVCWLQYLRHMGSVVVASKLQSTGSVVVAHGLSCSMASLWDLPGPGIELVSRIGRWIPIHCTTREVLEFFFFNCGKIHITKFTHINQSFFFDR